MNLFLSLVIFNGATLSCYGLSCLCSNSMREEFARYGLSKFRIMTGTLELLGSIGVAIGLVIPWIGLLAASGLSALLFSGFCVRIKIKDGVLKSIPALFYFLLNGYLAFLFFQIITRHSP